MSRPIIVTLTLNEEAQRFFEARRRAHFPPERNHLSAHVTLFHHLPGDQAAAVEASARDAANRQRPFDVAVTAPYSLGGGVAYGLDAAPIEPLRAMISAPFTEHLTPQDRGTKKPHVTVQNKVTKRAAQRTLGTLRAEFTAFTAEAEGIALWHYDGGPWEAMATLPFSRG